MKFKIKVQNKDTGSSWWEEYDENIDNPNLWSEEVIESFNNTLKPNEGERVLLEVVILDTKSQAKHNWVKSNLVTIQNRDKIYDTYKCSECEITSKRFGLSSYNVLDSKYKAKVYKRCDTSKKHIELKRLKGNNDNS